MVVGLVRLSLVVSQDWYSMCQLSASVFHKVLCIPCCPKGFIGSSVFEEIQSTLVISKSKGPSEIRLL